MNTINNAHGGVVNRDDFEAMHGIDSDEQNSQFWYSWYGCVEARRAPVSSL